MTHPTETPVFQYLLSPAKRRPTPAPAAGAPPAQRLSLSNLKLEEGGEPAVKRVKVSKYAELNSEELTDIGSLLNKMSPSRGKDLQPIVKKEKCTKTAGKVPNSLSLTKVRGVERVTKETSTATEDSKLTTSITKDAKSENGIKLNKKHATTSNSKIDEQQTETAKIDEKTAHSKQTSTSHAVKVIKDNTNGTVRKQDKEQEALSPLLLLVLDHLTSIDRSNVFRDPVDPLEVPDYLEVVEKPMDLCTMRTKVEQGHYGDIEDFQEDFSLVVSNQFHIGPYVCYSCCSCYPCVS